METPAAVRARVVFSAIEAPALDVECGVRHARVPYGDCISCGHCLGLHLAPGELAVICDGEDEARVPR